MVASADTGWAVFIEGQLSAALYAAILNAARTPDNQIANTSAETPRQESAGPKSGDEILRPLLPAGQLDLVLDVQLGLTLRFGSKSMLLRDILQLNAGSVLELDRQVQEPVELLLDGKLIARGEVVVVDGNYGLRVREVVSASVAA